MPEKNDSAVVRQDSATIGQAFYFGIVRRVRRLPKRLLQMAETCRSPQLLRAYTAALRCLCRRYSCSLSHDGLPPDSCTLQLQFGWKLSDPTAWRSMKRLGVHGYIRKRKLPTSYTGMEHTRYANILNRNFRSDKPLKKIVTDVTYIKHHGKWVYLAAYLDLFNNEIVEWELSDTFDNFLIMRPAERLLKKTDSTKLPILLHSDQGVPYSSVDYCNLLSEYNVIQSMSRAGNPYDNAVMESFWGRFKDTLRKHFRYWE